MLPSAVLEQLSDYLRTGQVVQEPDLIRLLAGESTAQLKAPWAAEAYAHLRMHLPREAWGSPDTVRAWIESHRPTETIRRRSEKKLLTS
jgi:hypothetical protein